MSDRTGTTLTPEQEAVAYSGIGCDASVFKGASESKREQNKRFKALRNNIGPYGEAYSVRPVADDEGSVFLIGVSIVVGQDGWEVIGNPHKLSALFRSAADRIDATWPEGGRDDE